MPKTNMGIICQLKKLKQMGDLELYRIQSEELWWLLLTAKHVYHKTYFVDKFLTRLIEDIRFLVLHNRPKRSMK